MVRRWEPARSGLTAALLTSFCPAAPGILPAQAGPPVIASSAALSGPAGPAVSVTVSFPQRPLQHLPRVAAAPLPRSGTAFVEVQVPPQAALWFNGVRMHQAGATRRFVTPPIPAGESYTYTVEARWREGGRELALSEQLTLRPGERASLVLPTPAAETAAPVRSAVIETPQVFRPGTRSTTPHMSLVELDPVTGARRGTGAVSAVPPATLGPARPHVASVEYPRSR